MRSTFELLLLLLFAFGPAMAEDTQAPSKMETFELALVDDIYRSARREFSEQLVESGMDESDAEWILYELSASASNCVLNRMREYASQNGLAVEDLVRDPERARLKKEHSIVLDEGEDDSMMNCFMGAIEQAGLQVE